MRRSLSHTLLLVVLFAAFPATAAAQSEDICQSCQRRNWQRCYGQCKHPNVVKSRESICYVECMMKDCGQFCASVTVPADLTRPNQKPDIPPPAPTPTEEEKRAREPESLPPPEHEGEGACGSCLQQRELGMCVNLCRNAVDELNCRKRCAKRECALDCQLPARQQKQSQEPTERDCDICRRTAKSMCVERCGHDTDRAGYTTCIVSCVEDRCLETCNPELF